MGKTRICGKATVLAGIALLTLTTGTGCAPKEEAGDAAAANAAPNAAPANFETTKAKIMADPHIPEAQKAMLLKQMQDKSGPRPPANP